MNRRWLPSILLGLGGLLLGSICLEVFLRATGSAPLRWPFVAGILTSLPFAGMLIVGGYSLTSDILPAKYYWHLGLGTVAGIVFFIVFFAVVAFSLFETWLARAGVLRWGLTVGAATGFLISFLYALGISHDVALERQSVQAAEAEREQELLEYLNALLRHEVLNTATAIQAHADLAEQVTENETVEDRLGVVQRQTDGLTSVIDDVQVLLAARGENDSLERIDLVTCLRKEVRALEDRHPAVETTLQLPENIAVRGDNLLPRLFSNLLDNAVEHNDSATPEVSIRATECEDTVEIHIRDNGPGFPTDSLDDLSEPLREMDTSHGLGLAIVRRLAHHYGGGIELTETTSSGSHVTVRLQKVSE